MGITLVSSFLLFAQLAIDGEWKRLDPQPQPTVEVASPFSLYVTDPPPNAIITWRWPRGLDVWSETEERLQIAGDHGTYRVTAIVRTFRLVDGEITIDSQLHPLIFRIGDGGEVDDPENPDPDDPDYTSFTDLCRAAAEELDRDTARNIGQWMESFADSADRGKGLTSLKRQVTVAIDDILLRRNNNLDWESVWRVPLNDLFRATGEMSIDQYLAALRACATGLLAAPGRAQAARPPPTAKVVMWSRPDCVPCREWEQHELPLFTAAGFEYEKRLTKGSAPRYRIYYGGHTYPHDGYLPWSSVANTIRR